MLYSNVLSWSGLVNLEWLETGENKINAKWFFVNGVINWSIIIYLVSYKWFYESLS